MAASIFDTLRYARRLEEAGVEPRQAAAMADALAVEFVPNIATSTALGNAVSELKAWFKAELKAEIAVLEARLTWRLLGGVSVIVGLAVALIKLG